MSERELDDTRRCTKHLSRCISLWLNEVRVWGVRGNIQLPNSICSSAGRPTSRSVWILSIRLRRTGRIGNGVMRAATLRISTASSKTKKVLH